MSLPKLISPEAKAHRWLEDVHIRIRGLETYEFDKQDLIDHILKYIEPLDLTIKPIFDDDLSSGGIDFYYRRYGLRANPYNTRQGTSYVKGQKLGGIYETIVPFTTQFITIDKDHLDLYKGNNRHHAFLNSGLHEFIHAFCFYEEHLAQHRKMPNPLMSSELSTSILEWSYSDQRLLLDKYGRRGKEFNFKESDLGKDLILLHKKKPQKHSIAKNITDTRMHIEGLKRGKYKKIIK